jgi:hypothetical protein
VICVQLPELAINHIKVLVTEVVIDFVDVILLILRTERRLSKAGRDGGGGRGTNQKVEHHQKVGPPQFAQSQLLIA